MSSRYVHGGKHTKLYHIWCGMKNRCYNPNEPKYPNYGGRGILVCDEWRHDFLQFKEWANLNGYCDGLSIDRVDVNGNYSPLNCRWATQKEQQNNRRNNTIIFFNGEAHTMSEWATITGISVQTLSTRKARGFIDESLFYKGNLKYRELGE